MHPMIKPALRRSWRNGHTVQYGVAPAHAVQFGPVDNATGSFLDMLDGTRSVAQLRDAAQPLGLGAQLVDKLLGRLGGAGVLDDSTAERATAAQVGERLRPDLASLSLLHPEPGGALRRLATRRASRVRVCGGGRVGAGIASLLSAAGVGQVEALDGGCVAPGDTGPGGLSVEQVGERRVSALRRAVRKASPWARAPRQRGGEQRGFDLVVIAPRDGIAAYAPYPDSARELVETGQAHLYAGVVEGSGFVGPLVLPGSSSCAECMMLARTEREPGWALVVGQWRSSRHTSVPACDGALAGMVAGAAANSALRYLDGDDTDTVGHRVSYVLPHMWREDEELPAYAGCPCGAASAVWAPGAGPVAQDPQGAEPGPSPSPRPPGQPRDATSVKTSDPSYPRIPRQQR